MDKSVGKESTTTGGNEPTSPSGPLNKVDVNLTQTTAVAEGIHDITDTEWRIATRILSSYLLFSSCLQLRHEWCSFWSLVFKLSSVTPSWVVFILISCFQVVFSYAMSGVHSDLLFSSCLQLRCEWCSFWSLVFKLSSVTPSWVVFILISCFQVVFSYTMSGVRK